VCGIINTLSTLLGIFKLLCFVTKNICRLILSLEINPDHQGRHSVDVKQLLLDWLQFTAVT
jgi:hypothetical protein